MAKVAVFLTDGFADWEYALIGGAGGPFYGLDVRYFSAATGQLSSQGGLSVNVTKSSADLLVWRADVVAVIGGAIWETDAAPDISKLLHVLRNDGAVVGAICGATLAFARAGLLNDRDHTSNDPDFLAQNVGDYTGAAHYKTSPSAVTSDGVITAPGTAPVSFAAAVFAAASVPIDAISQFKSMMAAEHIT